MPAGTIETRETLSRHALGPQEVLDFCERHAVLAEAALAIGLLREQFPSAESVTIRVKEDHETGERWLLVRAAVREDPETAFQKYQAYLERWVGQVRWPASALVGLDYTCAG
jgi:hypothetical protein